MTWIAQALKMGAQMRVKVCEWRPSHYVAVMQWPHCPTICGLESTSIAGAINNLETALTEDCANEMLANGSA